MLKWGEGEYGLDRVRDTNTGQVQECLQVTLVLPCPLLLQACNDLSYNLETSTSSYPSSLTLPNRSPGHHSSFNKFVSSRADFCLVVGKVHNSCKVWLVKYSAMSAAIKYGK